MSDSVISKSNVDEKIPLINNVKPKQKRKMDAVCSMLCSINSKEKNERSVNKVNEKSSKLYQA